MTFYIRVPSLITPVHCITQTEDPSFFIPQNKIDALIGCQYETQKRLS